MGQSYLKNAALLTGADILLRLAGMGLRIYRGQTAMYSYVRLSIIDVQLRTS